MLFQRRSGRERVVTDRCTPGCQPGLAGSAGESPAEQLGSVGLASPYPPPPGGSGEGTKAAAGGLLCPGLTQLLEAGMALQHQGQLLGALVADLVVAQVQLPKGAVARQSSAEGGKGVFPCAQVVPLQGEAAGRVDVRCTAQGASCSHGAQGGLRRVAGLGVSGKKSGVTLVTCTPNQLGSTDNQPEDTNLQTAELCP